MTHCTTRWKGSHVMSLPRGARETILPADLFEASRLKPSLIKAVLDPKMASPYVQPRRNVNSLPNPRQRHQWEVVEPHSPAGLEMQTLRGPAKGPEMAAVVKCNHQLRQPAGQCGFGDGAPGQLCDPPLDHRAAHTHVARTLWGPHVTADFDGVPFLDPPVRLDHQSDLALPTFYSALARADHLGMESPQLQEDRSGGANPGPGHLKPHESAKNLSCINARYGFVA